MNFGQIGDVALKVDSWNPIRDGHDQLINYIDLSSIDQDTKTIQRNKPIVAKEAPSRARQLIQEGDVLVSTVRPNLNGVAMVDKSLDGATASTGFCVLRPNVKKLDCSYLFHWVKTSEFISDMVRKSTGASYPAVSDRIVLESKIPLPPIAEQKRIAAILDKAEEIRSQRRQALEQLDAIGQSIFLEMFGDPVKHGWTIATIAEILHPSNGSIRTGPFGSQLLHSEFIDKGVAVLGIDNAVFNEFRWSERRFISESKYRELKRYTVRPGDVLITIMGTCGRCAIVPDNIPVAINTKHLCCITLNQEKCLPKFLHAYFLLHPIARQHLDQTMKGAIMAGLNMALIKSMPIPIPPIALQQEFARRVEAIAQLKATHRESLAQLDALFASLQHRAFRGEL
jgi:type I restriction enzyme, S subunit